MRYTALVIAGIMAAQISPALAQEAEQRPEYHALATLDRVGTRSGAGISLSYRRIDDEYQDSVLRYDLHARLVAASGVGVALSLPFTRVSGDYDDEQSRGNPGIIGFGRRYLGPALVMLQVGVFLPMARDDYEAIRYAIRGGIGRLTDLATAFPDTLTLRLGASPELELGSGLFVRGDAGLDLMIISADETDFEPLARINLAAGRDTGPVSMALELSTVVFLGDLGPNNSLATHAMAVSARLRQGSVRPHIALTVPLDDDLDREFGVVLMAGVEALGR